MKHNQIPRDKDYTGRLIRALEEQYDIPVWELTPARRGYYGETWKVKREGVCYFLKIDALSFHQQRFRHGLSVVDYLCASGIDFAGRVIKTRDGSLSAPFDDALMGLFEWVDGENVETDDTKPPEYQMLCQIYSLPRPGLGIPAEDFSEEAARRFYRQWEAIRQAPRTAADEELLSILEQYRGVLSHCSARLAELAARCREDLSGFYLTHGDAGGNFFVGNGRSYIFDWDEAMYAPVERDAWVMGCYGWARELFDSTLRANHISYQLRPERLAFYCYHMCFFYLGEFLMVHPVCDQSGRLREYFEDGWIWSRVQYADAIQ